MTVNSVSSVLDTISSQYTTSTAKEDDNDTMYMDDFLNVFMAQLEYQDPLNPVEGTEMTSQLAQITSVEQQYNTNEKLDTISDKLDDVYSTELLQCIGKDVELDGEGITVQDGETSGGISFSIEEAAQVEVSICDSEGNEIRLIEVGEVEAGSHQIEWDGKDSEGETVADGSYTYEVSATDVDGQVVTTQSENRLRITGLTYQDGDPYLLAGELQIDPASVLSVYDPSV
jgi:flagellar basal-body rod modification protein FlgD